MNFSYDEYYTEQNDSLPSKTVHISINDVDKTCLAEVLYNFKNFLVASGYYVNGDLVISQPHVDDEIDIEWDNRPEAEYGSFRMVRPSEE